MTVRIKVLKSKVRRVIALIPPMCEHRIIAALQADLPNCFWGLTMHLTRQLLCGPFSKMKKSQVFMSVWTSLSRQIGSTGKSWTKAKATQMLINLWVAINSIATINFTRKPFLHTNTATCRPGLTFTFLSFPSCLLYLCYSSSPTKYKLDYVTVVYEITAD